MFIAIVVVTIILNLCHKACPGPSRPFRDLSISKGSYPNACRHPTWQFPSPNNCSRLLSQDTWGLRECFLIHVAYNPSNPNNIFHNQDRMAIAFVCCCETANTKAHPNTEIAVTVE